MEIDRAVLKKQAWNSLKGIYWFMLIVCIIAGIVGAGSTGVGFNFGVSGGVNTETASDGELHFNVFDYHFDSVEEFFNAVMTTDRLRIFLCIILFAAVMGMLLLLAFRIFISGPAEVSFARTKLKAVIDRNMDGENLLYGFKAGYKRITAAVLLKNFYLFLWSLLPALGMLPGFGVGLWMMMSGTESGMLQGAAIVMASALVSIALSVPVMVKQYQYMLVPYILSEKPDTGARAAIRLSKDMMNGFKWQAFVLRLSFIGWYLLGAICCGIGIWFVEPYYQAAETLLYEELKAYYNGNHAGPDGGAAPIETTVVE